MKTQTFLINHEEQTTIAVGKGLLASIGELLKEKRYTGFLLLSSPQTKELYASPLLSSLEALQVPVSTLVIDNGEEYKSLATVEKALNAMLQAGLDKKCAVIALGGGVIGDVATLIAALYYRGVDCIQVPTTLLAQVDSSYGGKGGVNLGNFKNMVGVVNQPRFVIVDTSTLASLPKIQLLSGMGEVVKYGIAHDKTFFDYLESQSPETIDLEEAIHTCSGIKMHMVVKDPFDTGDVRIALNFGHTMGHAVERLGKLPHGLAVSVGMAFSIRLSEKIGILKTNTAKKALSLLGKYDLPITVEKVDKEDVLHIMKKDKKMIGGNMRFVLLSEIGRTKIVDNINPDIINEVLSEIIR